jgi:frataxin
MALNEYEFQDVADEWLDRCFEAIESQDAEAALDIDLENGVMTIIVDEDNTFIVSKHAPSSQIWLSSPISGGLHFDAEDDGESWVLDDGRSITTILAEELSQLTNSDFDLDDI